MQQYGLIGSPLGRSMSKLYFTQKFETENLDAQFELFEMQNAQEIFALVANNPALCGFNVTFPLKEKIIPLLDELDRSAAEIGAVNCVKVERRNDNLLHLKGFNTDTLGFENAIRPFLNEKICSALVCGTGGASKAVVAALQRMGIGVTLCSRTKTVKTLTYAEITPSIISDNLLIVNATNVGFGDLENQCVALPYAWLTSEHLLFDVIYNPPETLFLQQGRQRGARVVNGRQMFVKQAQAAWCIWNG